MTLSNEEKIEKLEKDMLALQAAILLQGSETVRKTLDINHSQLGQFIMKVVKERMGISHMTDFDIGRSIGNNESILQQLVNEARSKGYYIS